MFEYFLKTNFIADKDRANLITFVNDRVGLWQWVGGENVFFKNSAGGDRIKLSLVNL